MILSMQLLEERVVLDAAGGAELLQAVGEWSSPIGGEAALSLESSLPITYQIETGNEPVEFPLYSKAREFKAFGPQLYLQFSDANNLTLESNHIDDWEVQKREAADYRVIELLNSTQQGPADTTGTSISLQILDLDIEFSFSSFSLFDSHVKKKGVLLLQSIESSPLDLFDSTAYNSLLFGEKGEPSSVDYRETSNLMKGLRDEGIHTDAYYHQRVPGLFLSTLDLEEDGEWEGELLLGLEALPPDRSIGSQLTETQISFHDAAQLLAP